MRKIFPYIILTLFAFILIPTDNNVPSFTSSNSGLWLDTFSTNFSGNGTNENPYLISTPEELAGVAYLVNNKIGSYNEATYSIENDIDLGGKDWQCIGNGEDYTFKGTIKGNNKHIKNMTVVAGAGGYASFIGYSIGARVEDLIFDNPTLLGNNCFVGTVLGNDSGSFLNYILVNNLSVSATNVAYCGGIVGWSSGNIEHVYCNGRIDVFGDFGQESNVGGIAGFFAGEYIHYAINYADVDSHEGNFLAYTGGIIGKAGGYIGYGEGNIRASYNCGNVTSLANLGGYAAGICAQNYYVNKTYCNANIYGKTKSYALTNNGGGQDSAYYLKNMPANLGGEDISFSCTEEELKKFEIQGTDEYFEKEIEYINNGFPILKWYYWMCQV